jgi:hypothetical protein
LALTTIGEEFGDQRDMAKSVSSSSSAAAGMNPDGFEGMAQDLDGAEDRGHGPSVYFMDTYGGSVARCS